MIRVVRELSRLRTDDAFPAEIAGRFTDFVARWSSQYRGHWLERFTQLVSSADSATRLYIVSTESGEAVAGAFMETSSSGYSRELRAEWVSNVWVAPEMRSRGVAHLLIRQMLEQVQTRTVLLTTDRARQGRSDNLYADLGFEHIPKTKAMQFHVGPSERIQPSANDRGLTADTVVVRSSDIGTIAIIQASEHYEIVNSGIEICTDEDPEEIMARYVAVGCGYGHIIQDAASGLPLWIRQDLEGALRLSVPISKSSRQPTSETLNRLERVLSQQRIRR